MKNKNKIILFVIITIFVLILFLIFFILKNIKSTLNSQNLQSNDKTKIEENLVTNTNTNISINDNTPVSTHGKLTVSGTKIIDEHGNTFSLKGVSSHGLAWFPEYINEDSFKSLRDNFGINTIRLANIVIQMMVIVKMFMR